MSTANDSCSSNQAEDPSLLSPVWANFVIAVLLFVERCVRYLVPLLINRGRTMCVCQSCCGLFGAKMKTVESERAKPQQEEEFEDAEQEPPDEPVSEA